MEEIYKELYIGRLKNAYLSVNNSQSIKVVYVLTQLPQLLKTNQITLITQPLIAFPHPNQKSSFLTMGNTNSSTYLSAMNLALALLQSTLYWKYQMRQNFLVWMTICLSFRSSWIYLVQVWGSEILYVIQWQWLEDGSTPDMPRNTSQVPTFWRQKVQYYGRGRGSYLMMGRSATYYQLQIWCFLLIQGFFVVTDYSIFYYSLVAQFLPFGTYFCPILAYILAKGFATSFYFSSPPPILPGLSILPLNGFWTIYIYYYQPPISSLRAIMLLWSNIIWVQFVQIVSNYYYQQKCGVDIQSSLYWVWVMDEIIIRLSDWELIKRNDYFYIIEQVYNSPNYRVKSTN